MPYQYKALRVQLVKTHTRPGGASCYEGQRGGGGGSRTHVVAMVTTGGSCDCRCRRPRGGVSQQRRHLLLVSLLLVLPLFSLSPSTATFLLPHSSSLHPSLFFFLSTHVSLPFPSYCGHSSTTVRKLNLYVLNFSADTEILLSYFLFKEVGGMCTGGTQLPPVVCVYTWCVLCVYVLSTLELVDFRALCVHVRVIQRVARRVAVGRRRVLWRVSVRGVRVCVVLESVRAGVEAQIGEFGGRVAALCGVLVAEVLQVHEPLGPESPADAVAVHGQVDELACRGQTAEWARGSEYVMQPH